MRCSPFILLLAMSMGCGARTSLDAPEPRNSPEPVDAGPPPRPDAGFERRDAAVERRDGGPLEHEPVVMIAAGLFHTCAATRVGRVHCWGFNNRGQVGDGTSVTRLDPMPTSAVSDAVAITAGRSHSCALLGDGTMRCWGANANGQLGAGTLEFRHLTPVRVIGLSRVTQIDAGGNHTCAVTDDGRAFCWGDFSRDPEEVPLDEPVLEISAGFEHTCARLASGRVACWVRRDELIYVDVPPIRSLASADFESCGVDAGGRVHCWDVSREVVPVATRIDQLGTVTSVSAGHEFRCATDVDGRVVCTGRNDNGQLGDGGIVRSGDRAVYPVDLPTTVRVEAGWRHACAIDPEGVVRCWGRSWEGQLGDGLPGDSRTPVIANVFRDL